jgi:hypothetical protein
MNSHYVAFCMGLILGSAPMQANAAETDADQDTTLVTRCESLRPTVSVAVMSRSDTTSICREMARVLEGIRRKDITNFEKAVYLLQSQGYEEDDAQIAKELVEIIRLRGLYDKPDRWYATNDVIVRSWTAFREAVGPRQVISFLQAEGPAAKRLSDDGLGSMIVLMKEQYQRGEE